MFKEFKPALSMLLALTVITGVVYPALVTGIGQLLFAAQANGSLIAREGRIVGSRLVGQSFSDPAYFWSRPSATAPVAYNGGASGASNLGPLNPALEQAVTARILALRVADPAQGAPIPVDLVTSSASGLDPHLSPAAAFWQAPRIAHQRQLTLAAVHGLIDQHREERQWGFLGEPRVNVLMLNLSLDAMAPR